MIRVLTAAGFVSQMLQRLGRLNIRKSAVNQQVVLTIDFFEFACSCAFQERIAPLPGMFSD